MASVRPKNFFNFGNKLLFGARMVQAAETAKVLPDDSIGSRNNKVQLKSTFADSYSLILYVSQNKMPCLVHMMVRHTMIELYTHSHP